MQMTAAVKTRKNRKFNWEPVERDMDMGLSTGELSLKYSIPKDRIRSRRRERRLKLGASVLLHANNGEGGSGLPVPYQSVTPIYMQTPGKLPMVTDSPPPADLTNDQLVTLLADPEAVLQLKPEELEKLAGRRFQMALAAALVEMPEVRTLKDLATVHKLFREANGLSGDQGKGGNGLLSPPRAFGRKMVTMDAVEVRPPASVSCGLEAPEGGWPEGMG